MTDTNRTSKQQVEETELLQRVYELVDHWYGESKRLQSELDRLSIGSRGYQKDRDDMQSIARAVLAAQPDETTANPNNAPAKDLLIVATGPWNENRFTVCRGTTEVEDDIIADFVHRSDAELFVAAKRSAMEPSAPQRVIDGFVSPPRD